MSSFHVRGPARVLGAGLAAFHHPSQSYEEMLVFLNNAPGNIH